MLLTEFVNERHVEYTTVYNFLKRNKLLDIYCKKVNGKLTINDNGIEFLKKKYPLSIEVENTTQQELIEAQKEIIHLQRLLVDVQPKLLLLEQNENEMKQLKAKNELLITENENLIHKNNVEYEQLTKEIERLNKLLNDTRDECEQEKNKSWFAKLLGK